MFDTPVVMIDFETSGMSPEQGGRVTEVAALRIVGTEVVDRYVSLINCHVRIPYFITQLTGITQSMVDAAPPASEVIPELLRFIGRDTLAAHNASFDEKFLLAESARLGLIPEHDGLLCSVKLSRRVFPGLPSYSLGSLASSLGIRFKGAAHRAEADAEVASVLMLHIASHLQQIYDMTSVNPRLLLEINKVAAAKVPSFLQKQLVSVGGNSAVKKELNATSKYPVRAIEPVASKRMQRYRHYKGGIYDLVCEAIQESDLTPIIVYRSHNGSIWTRSKAVFFEVLMIEGKKVQRFTAIDEQE